MLWARDALCGFPDNYTEIQPWRKFCRRDGQCRDTMYGEPEEAILGTFCCTTPFCRAQIQVNKVERSMLKLGAHGICSKWMHGQPLGDQGFGLFIGNKLDLWSRDAGFRQFAPLLTKL